MRRFLAVFALAVGACVGRDKFAQVEADFRRSFPIGTPAVEVIRRLDSLGIGHSPLGVDTIAMTALVKAVSKDAVTRTDAQFDLVFEAGKLSGISAKKVFTGP